MIKGFWWVFAAYGVVWLVLFGYVLKLLGGQRELERSVEALEAERRSPTS